MECIQKHEESPMKIVAGVKRDVLFKQPELHPLGSHSIHSLVKSDVKRVHARVFRIRTSTLAWRTKRHGDVNVTKDSAK